MENSNSPLVENRLKKWCDSLLDLSKRNPSLNFLTHSKSGKKKPNVYKVGLNNDQLFKKIAIEGKSVSISELQFVDETNDDDDEFSSLFESNNIIKKITRLKRDTESIIEERGTHVLYLTFGVVEWKEEKISEEALSTPLLFVPVNIHKTRTRDRFSIQLSDLSDIEFNPTFAYLLKKLYGIEMDSEVAKLVNSQEKEVTVSEILDFIESEISKVVEGTFKRETWLSKFWFEKLVLFTDIQKNVNSFAANKNIKNICGEGTLNDLNANIELEVLEKLASTRGVTDTFEVLDADSSQRIAIEAAINGKNFVLIGPPGTGKSQTITNIIAECLARGKKVLFVSEKLAALKVVEKKLRESKLGRFCMAIHGKDVKKKEFYPELFDWYETVLGTESTIDDAIKMAYEELDEKKNKLNDYAFSLAAKDEKLNRLLGDSSSDLNTSEITAQYIQSKLIEMKDVPTVKTKLNIEELDEFKYKSQKEVLERTLAFKDIVLKEVVSDWFLTKLEGPFTGQIKEDGNETLKKMQDIKLIADEIEAARKHIGLEEDIKLGNLQDFVVLINTIVNAPKIDPVWLNYELFQKVLKGFEKDRRLHVSIKEEKEKLNRHFRDEFLTLDVKQLKRNFVEKYEGEPTRFFAKDYWNTRKKTLKYKARNKKNGLWIRDEVIFDEIERGIRIQILENEIKKNEFDLKTKYATYYKGEDTNWEELSSLVFFVDGLFNQLRGAGININEPLPAELVEIMSSIKSPIKKDLKSHVESISKPLEIFQAGFQELDRYFDITFNKEMVNNNQVDIKAKYILAEKNLGELTLSEVDLWVQKMKEDLNSNPSLLERWFYFKKVKNKIDDLGLSDFVEDVASDLADSYGMVVDILEKRTFEQLYMKMETTYPALSGFNLDDHSRTQEEFNRLDKQSIDLNRERLYKMIAGSIKDEIKEENTPAVKLIKKLGNQKHPRMPIRTSIKTAGDFFLKLKPCWMMSPISVSQYCPPDDSLFDVVVFDEASQVRPADAIGAIYRGKQVIVVGDPRQLPPTNFFQKITQGDDVELDNLDDISEESIIDEIKSRASDFAEMPLRWHYRSKSEDLFTFANENIYPDLNLVTFPNPTDITEDGKPLGIRHIHVANGVYDRGVTRTNGVEADKVADLVVEHFSNNPTDKSDPNFLSLGVIAFSAAQEKAIVDSLYRRKREFPFLENVLDDREGEHFFVKNLETVQGDERDHIIISVGYGPDREGKISNNFGPVNQEGGERRLNVAITRSKRNLLLVSSFTHTDISLNSTQKGPQLLVKYLEYAENGGKSRTVGEEVDENVFDSKFDEIVFNLLKKNGLELRTQIGNSACKVNMAVVNPQIRDSFLFSIESDGPSYYKNSSTRDRERLKTQILSDRGWDIYRIWSKEWMKNPEAELQKIIDKYRKIVDEQKQTAEPITPIDSGVIDFDPLFSEESA